MIKEQTENTFFPTRIELVNRKNEKRMIGEAIHSGKRNVLFFVAQGGIGKTRLLEEVFDQRGSLAQIGIRTTDLIDLFHSEFHSPDNMQNHIVEQIDPLNRFFQLYREAREKFLEAEGQGMQRKALAELAEKRDQQFLEDYRALTEIGKVRPLLLIDTTEQIQHESDAVQTLCSVQVENLATYSWLIHTAPLLPNTIILLAGRPRPEFETQVEESFKKHEWLFQRQDLSVLAPDDALDYIQLLSRSRPRLLNLREDEKRWVVELTGGKPILLGLALQYIHYEKGLDRLRGEVERGEERDKVLIEHLIDMDDEYGKAMHYMLLARNGMDADLLAYLTEWPQEKIEGFFKEMKGNVLFKSRGKALFLHDELYELYDTYYRDDIETMRDFGKIARYYRNLLSQPRPYKEVLELRLLSLFYELREHMERGYHLFSMWDEEAIWLHFRSHDLRTRDDLIKFINRYMRPGAKFYDEALADQVPVEIIDSDNAIRCIERAIAEEKYNLALELAETIQNSEEPIFIDRMRNDRLFQARVFYGMAEAALYRGRSEQARSLLQKIISLLETWQPPTDEAIFWKERTLGRAYNRLGYYYRVHGYYAKAIPFYRKAVTEFREGEMLYLLAQTKTNLSFILAQTNDAASALELAKEARVIWETYGMTYRMALTLSAMARIFVELNKPVSARKAISLAKESIQKLEETRANIMLDIGEGRVLRAQGNQWKEDKDLYSLDEADGYMQEGENILQHAEEVMVARGLDEALIRWEIYNELGSLYCDWAWLQRQRGKRILASTCYRNSIKYQEQALSIAQEEEMPFQIADSLDDLAQVYGDRIFFLIEEKRDAEADEMLQKAKEALAMAEKTVPQEYHQTRTGNLNDHEDGAPFWLVLGKANLWRGVWKFRLLESQGQLSLAASPKEVEEATQDLLASQVYFKRYGENSQSIDRSMRYLSRFIQAANVTFDWMEAQISKAEEKYHTKLPVVRMRMQNKLGL